MYQRYDPVKFCIVVASMFILSACGADVGLGRPPSSQQAVADGNRNMDTGLVTLPPRDLGRGECAVFLWSTESARPLVYIQNIATEKSTVLVDHTSVEFDRHQASDMIIPGFFARQGFEVNDMELNVRLLPEEGRNLYEGIKIPSGVLTIRNQDNRETMIAVSGLLGCNLER